MRKKRVNWHVATVSAIRLALLDYEDLLEYQTEYVLVPSAGDKRTATEAGTVHGQRIDLLDTDSYYKASGYVSQLIFMSGKANEYTRNDVTLSLVTQSHPAKLFRHLKEIGESDENCRVSIEKTEEGLYYVRGETYATQIIVMRELSEEMYRYLRCLCDLVKNQKLLKATIDECNRYRDNPVYDSYANEVISSVYPKEVDNTVCEAVFEFFGTSSAEVAEKAAREADARAQVKIDALSRENEFLSMRNSSLQESLAKMEALLRENNIPIPTR